VKAEEVLTIPMDACQRVQTSWNYFIFVSNILA